MVENSPLEVSTWISRLDLISRIPSLPIVFLVYFPTIKLGWMSLFFVLLPTIRFLLSMYSASTEQNYAPLLKNLVPSWVNRRLMISSSLPWVGIFLLCYELCWVSFLPRQIGGVFLASSTLGQSLSIFLVWPVPRVRGHASTSHRSFHHLPPQASQGPLTSSERYEL